MENDIFLLNSHETCLKRKDKFAANFKVIETESNKMRAKTLVQSIKGKHIVINAAKALKEQI